VCTVLFPSYLYATHANTYACMPNPKGNALFHNHTSLFLLAVLKTSRGSHTVFVVAVANSGALSAGQRVSISVGAGRASIGCLRLCPGAGVRIGIIFSSVIICASIRAGIAVGIGVGDWLGLAGPSKYQEKAGHQHAQLEGETNARHLHTSFKTCTRSELFPCT
jgi:hypothetical protein